jgi:hypothetical protein
MKRSFTILQIAAASAAVLAVAAFAPPPAKAQSMRTVDGQAFWRGDPGPIDPGTFWSGGEYQHDPHHYLDNSRTSPAAYSDVVYAEHSGKERCVWRKRVVNSGWEHQHPYLMVCRN